VPVHLNCLGYNHKTLAETNGNPPFRSLKFSFARKKKDDKTGIETEEKIETQILIFKCDACKHLEKQKSKIKPKCIVCLQDEGFMKKVKKISSKENSQVV